MKCKSHGLEKELMVIFRKSADDSLIELFICRDQSISNEKGSFTINFLSEKDKFDLAYVFYLDYFRGKTGHFGGHMIVLAGYDEERGEAYVTDVHNEKIESKRREDGLFVTSLESLTEAEMLWMLCPLSLEICFSQTMFALMFVLFLREGLCDKARKGKYYSI